MQFISKDGVVFERGGKGSKMNLYMYPCGKKDAEYQVPNGTRHIEPNAFGSVEGPKYTKRVFIPKGVAIPNGFLEEGEHGTIESVCAHLSVKQLLPRENSGLLFAMGFLENLSEFDETERLFYTKFCKANGKKLLNYIKSCTINTSALAGFAEIAGS